MSSIRVSGNTSGYYDLTVPDIAGNNTVPLDRVVTTDSNGNLGIGTTSPVTTMHVAKPGNGILTVERTNKTSGTGYFGLNVETNSQTTLAYDNSSNFVIGRSGDPSTQAGFSNDFLINSSGNLGISKPTPLAKFHVGSTDDTVRTAFFDSQNSGDTDVMYIGRGWGSHKGSALHINSNNYTNGTNTDAALIQMQVNGYTGSNTRYMHMRDSSGSDFTFLGNGVFQTHNGPAFRSYINPDTTTTGQYMIAANGVTWATGNGSTVYNRGNCFSGGTFTAPADGVYAFSVGWDALSTNSQIDLYINQATPIVRWEPTGRTDDSWESHSYNSEAYLSAGDYVQLYARGGSGSNPFHMGGAYWGWFAGHMVG